MSWKNTLRGWFKLPEKPPATTGDTSVLFALESVYPGWLTLAELHDATHIPYDDLRRETERLLWMRRVTMEREEPGLGDAFRRYRIVHRKEDGSLLIC